MIIMPNCSGSMPRLLATGRNMGVQIRIRAAMSMIIPSTSNTALIINRIKIGFSVSPVTSATVFVGT